MATGPGPYDPEAMAALTTTGAGVVVVMILDGDRGSGFSVVVDPQRSVVHRALATVPGALREMADEVERSHPRLFVIGPQDPEDDPQAA